VKKHLLLIAVSLVIGTGTVFADVAAPGRSWTYLSGTMLLTPHWAFNVMPGIRYEFSRDIGAGRDTYLHELFAGPTYIMKNGPFTFKLPLWYYYMGFPVKANNAYYFTHSLEVIPIVEYRYNNWTFVNRVIFHNTFYASYYPSDEQRNGAVNKQLTLLLADEPFFGVFEDGDAPANNYGYWAKGFRVNRVYAGLIYAITPAFTVSPQYVFETNYDGAGKLTEIDHYVYVTFSYAWKLFH
jgi:hypothetical protein